MAFRASLVAQRRKLRPGELGNQYPAKASNSGDPSPAMTTHLVPVSHDTLLHVQQPYVAIPYFVK